MPAAQLPNLLHRGVGIFILAIGIGMIAVHTALAALSVQRSSGVRRPLTVAGAIGLYLTIWFGLAITVGDRTNFPLAREESRLWVSLLVGFGPMLLAIALLFASRTVRAVNAATARPWLIWAQTYRMAGLIFLFPFLAYGIVPAGFAIPAALGDFVTGALAPFVGRAVAQQRPHAIRWATAWNLFGVLDLIVAPAAAILSRAQLIGLYPLSLVPLFIGPPLGILTHVYSLRNLHTPSAILVDASPRAAGPQGSQRRLDEALRTT